jgi:hypothetical protein
MTDLLRIEDILPGADIVHGKEEVMSRIFHRPPCLRIEGILDYQDKPYAYFRPSQAEFDGHRPRMVGHILPGFPLGEYAAQGGLVLNFHSQKFQNSEHSGHFKSVIMVYLDDGRIQMIDRGIKPGDTVLFRLGRTKLECLEENIANGKRKLSATIDVFVPVEGELVKIARCAMKGTAVFSKQLARI